MVRRIGLFTPCVNTAKNKNMKMNKNKDYLT